MGLRREMGLRRIPTSLASLAAGFGASEALADQPRPWELGFQTPATVGMERINDFHNILLVIISVITVFVLALLIYVMVRFNERANPNPSKLTHSTILEMAWTALPVLILASIVIPSLKLLYFEAEIPKADLTVKVTGHTWNWSYEYPDNGDISFDSYIVADKDLKPGQPRLLTVDKWMEVPVGATVRVQITAADVIHSWSIPSFGIKTDAVPGRLNETWFKVERPGIYYGQCSQLCGNGHGYMPIVVKAVSKAEFDQWVADVKAGKGFDQADAKAAAGTELASAPAN
ncbi:MAG TPA: cytochrome c oxidase subunit II [Candidatus Udaeobacter sp.]|nr:cytochrome c oxidase subunit II [Candidatus Udaeobacter sp.]